MSDSDKSLDKVPSYNLEAAQSILGSILLDNSNINNVLKILSVDDFYNETHRNIFGTIIELFKKKELVDLITLSNALKDKGLLDSVGGTAYLSSLVANVTAPANIDNHAKIIKEKAILRELYGAAMDIAHSCLDAGSDIDQVLNSAGHSISKISRKITRHSLQQMKPIVKDSFLAIEEFYARKELVTGLATGFEGFDDLTCGLQQSDLIIVAGYPRVGKTTFALNITQFVAIEWRTPVAIFSMDNTKQELTFRMLSSEAKIDSQRIRKGFLGQTDWPKLASAAERLSESPLYIDDTPAITIMELEAKSRLLKTDADLGLIIVDYIQLMRTDSQSNNSKQDILEITRSLKALAKELKVPIIALSLLNNKEKELLNSRPHQMLDFRESGVNEQDADLIAFIFRDEVNNKQGLYQDNDIVEVIIAKQKNGPTGTVKLEFIEKFMHFNNLPYENNPPLRRQVTRKRTSRKRTKGNVVELNFQE